MKKIKLLSVSKLAYKTHWSKKKYHSKKKQIAKVYYYPKTGF